MVSGGGSGRCKKVEEKGNLIEVDGASTAVLRVLESRIVNGVSVPRC